MKKKKYYFSVRRGSNYRVYNTDGNPEKEVYFTKVEADKQARILNEKESILSAASCNITSLDDISNPNR